MPYAILYNDTITAHGTASSLWPDTSFADATPNPSFLADVGAVQIRSEQPYDPATQILVACEPYVVDGEVFDTVVTPIVAPTVEENIAKAWEAANAHAMSGMDLNSRSSLLWMALDHTCPEWRRARIVAVQQWWKTIWEHYGSVRQSILEGNVSYYDPTVAGECPWSIWELQVNE
jgi:hypothetical protein